MAGHSKWSNIKSKKEINDAKRSKIFTKLVKDISVAVRHGGAEPEFNPRLRLAIQNAKGANMPKEAILRAIRNSHGNNAASYHDLTYEGYGSHGVAIMVLCTTDKITRTVANVRAIFAKHGGSLEKSGSIAFLFHHKGVFTISRADMLEQEEDIVLQLIDAGAEELNKDEDYMYITCAMEDFGKLQNQIDRLSINPICSGLQYIPHTFVELSDAALISLIKLIDVLQDHDDVQHVYHNIAIHSDQEGLFE